MASMKKEAVQEETGATMLAEPSHPVETAAADWLTSAEQRTLEAVCAALIPAVSPPAGMDDPYGLFARSARDLGVARAMAEILAGESPESRAEFKQLLGLLRLPLCGLLLAGTPHSLASLPLAAREQALRAMSISAIPQLRQGFQALARLAAFIFYAVPLADGPNPNWPALGYSPAVAHETVPKRINTLAVEGDVALSADAVIVGSGAGGGVMAAELSAAGLDVVVLEKGGYYNESDFTGSEAEWTPKLYLRRGLLATRDLSMIVLAGSCLGGGTVVNWSTSLRTPSYVLEEWERDYGLSGATSAEYQRGFDVVEARMGVNTEDSAPNRNNAALQRGCEALGYHWSHVPRNTSGCKQRCGSCGYGCPYGRKQSTLLTFLQDASDRGARTIPDCAVERVLIEGGRAVGVRGYARDPRTGARHTITVRAPRVVVAGGAVESPALLLRSGLRNPNIGRHLRLHPVAAMAGYYAEPVEPWTGSLQTILSGHFAQMRDGYGLRFEVAPAHPGLIGMTTPWMGGQEHKRLMTRAAYEAVFIVLARDSGEGRVTLDKQGDPVLRYWPNKTDRSCLLRGMQETARIAVAGGASGVSTLHTPRLALEGEGGTPPTPAHLRDFLVGIERRGIGRNRMPLFSAHQMGTCRLGADPRSAVADPSGEVYGVPGLYIADGSGFPTASGVNPMLSVMALSYHVAQHIIAA